MKAIKLVMGLCSDANYVSMTGPGKLTLMAGDVARAVGDSFVFPSAVSLPLSCDSLALLRISVLLGFSLWGRGRPYQSHSAPRL